jgi:hypothetical protein
MHVFQLTLKPWKVWVEEGADRCRPRHHLMQQAEAAWDPACWS